jgi:hypothetical protein
MDRWVSFAPQLVLGLALIALSDPLVTHAGLTWARLASLVEENLAWFATHTPAGVKLHPQLSSFLSDVGLRYIATVRMACVVVTEKYFSLLVVTVGALTMVRGPEVLGRAAGLMLLPLSLAAAVMWYAGRAHFRLMKRLWRWMRDEAGSAYQLALSCLLFMPVLLTLPTMIWYSAFVCGLGAAAEVCLRLIITLILTKMMGCGPIDPIGCYMPHAP